MKQFIIELDDIICIWLEHISALTNQPIETLIANSVYSQIATLEDGIVKVFTYNE